MWTQEDFKGIFTTDHRIKFVLLCVKLCGHMNGPKNLGLPGPNLWVMEHGLPPNNWEREYRKNFVQSLVKVCSLCSL